MTAFAAAGHWRPPGAAPGSFLTCAPAGACLECRFECLGARDACFARGDPREFCYKECACDAAACYSGYGCSACARDVWLPEAGVFATYFKDGGVCKRCPDTSPIKVLLTFIAAVGFLYVFAQFASQVWRYAFAYAVMFISEYAAQLKGLGSPRILMSFLSVSLQVWRYAFAACGTVHIRIRRRRCSLRH